MPGNYLYKKKSLYLAIGLALVVDYFLRPDHFSSDFQISVLFVAIFLAIATIGQYLYFELMKKY